MGKERAEAAAKRVAVTLELMRMDSLVHKVGLRLLHVPGTFDYRKALSSLDREILAAAFLCTPARGKWPSPDPQVFQRQFNDLLESLKRDGIDHTDIFDRRDRVDAFKRDQRNRVDGTDYYERLRRAEIPPVVRQDLAIWREESLLAGQRRKDMACFAASLSEAVAKRHSASALAGELKAQQATSDAIEHDSYTALIKEQMAVFADQDRLSVLLRHKINAYVYFGGDVLSAEE